MFKEDFSTDAPGKILVYDIAPLLDAAESLCGTVSDQHFPILPGAHVPCATKEKFSENFKGKPEPGWIWCFLSVAIPEYRYKDASTLVPDVGFFSDFDNPKLYEDDVVKKLDKKLREVVYTQLCCGENQKVSYKEIFIGYKYAYIDEQSYGCAVAYAPYVTLARNAYPGGDPENLLTSLKTWEKSTLFEKN